jgi:hypothetical protein
MAQMDLIYSRALLTVIAAAGGDDSAGALGFRPRSRPRAQLTLSYYDVEIIAFQPWPFMPSKSQKQMINDITSSQGNTRSWTYQEALFSCRRLVLTPFPVHFSCREKSYSEDQIHGNDASRSDHNIWTFFTQ